MKKKQLNVRISPIFHDLLNQVIESEKQKGNFVKKPEMVEKAILLLAQENKKKEERIIE